VATFLDPKVPVRFEPPRQAGRDQPIAYLVRPPTVSDIATWDREWRAAGGRTWTVWQLIDALADAVRMALPDPEDPDRVRHLADIAEHRDTLAALAMTLPQLDRSDESAVADWHRRWSERSADPAIEELSETLRRHVPIYAGKLADNDVAGYLRGVVAARLFLVDWEGLPGHPRRGLSGLDEASVQMIPRQHLEAIGGFVERLSRPSETEEKNSASPPGGASAATASPVATTSPPTTP
jgi:hypothetical protein